MWIVTPETAGPEAYARMLRDGVVTALLPGISLPCDVEPTPAVRRHLLPTLLPENTQATGLAALWAHGLAPLPALIDVRARGRVHAPLVPTELPIVVRPGAVHPGVGNAASVAAVAQAVEDALRWGPLDLAVPAALCARDAGAITPAELDAALAEHSGRSADPQTRLPPVMRRAS